MACFNVTNSLLARKSNARVDFIKDIFVFAN